MMHNKIIHILLALLTLIVNSKSEEIQITPKFINIKDEKTNFQLKIDFSDLENGTFCSYKKNCLEWGGTRVTSSFQISDEDVCKNYYFNSTTLKIMKVIFNVTTIHFYGGGEDERQEWPSDKNSFEMRPFISSSNFSQAVLEPFWLFTTGHYVFVDKKVPLFVTLNSKEKTLELIGKIAPPYNIKNLIFNFKICKFPDMKLALMDAFNRVLGKPTRLPDNQMVLYPIFSTWVYFKTEINQQKVLEYAQSIFRNNFKISQIEIDDKWEICYGSLTVDKNRFPNLKELVKTLNGMNFRVTLWVHPFINTECAPFYEEGKRNDYFVKNIDGNINTTWWNGNASCIDFTNKNASKHMYEKLHQLMVEYNISSFKFDAGETSWLPQPPVFANNNSYPESNLEAYIKFATNFTKAVEVRVSRQTQNRSVFVRMIDRESSWNGSSSLSTIIPTTLLMNLLGYPYVLPDMVGGNRYGNKNISAELFIRWLQVNLFMPVVQFSYPPWVFEGNVTTVCTQLLRIRKRFTNIILHAMKKSIKDGTPVNPPIWWIDPNDTVAHSIDDEYLLDNILVAPVTTEGKIVRDIYLPAGCWKEGNKKKNLYIKGPTWLYNYSADINTVPFFINIKHCNAASILHLNLPLLSLLLLKSISIFTD